MWGEECSVKRVGFKIESKATGPEPRPFDVLQNCCWGKGRRVDGGRWTVEGGGGCRV